MHEEDKEASEPEGKERGAGAEGEDGVRRAEEGFGDWDGKIQGDADGVRGDGG